MSRGRKNTRLRRAKSGKTGKGTRRSSRTLARTARPAAASAGRVARALHAPARRHARPHRHGRVAVVRRAQRCRDNAEKQRTQAVEALENPAVPEERKRGEPGERDVCQPGAAPETIWTRRRPDCLSAAQRPAARASRTPGRARPLPTRKPPSCPCPCPVPPTQPPFLSVAQARSSDVQFSTRRVNGIIKKCRRHGQNFGGHGPLSRLSIAEEEEDSTELCKLSRSSGSVTSHPSAHQHHGAPRRVHRAACGPRRPHAPDAVPRRHYGARSCRGTRAPCPRAPAHLEPAAKTRANARRWRDRNR